MSKRGQFYDVFVGDNWKQSSTLEKLGRFVCGVLLLLTALLLLPFESLFRNDHTPR
jgi:hypothetical protein